MYAIIVVTECVHMRKTIRLHVAIRTECWPSGNVSGAVLRQRGRIGRRRVAKIHFILRQSPKLSVAVSSIGYEIEVVVENRQMVGACRTFSRIDVSHTRGRVRCIHLPEFSTFVSIVRTEI